MPHREIFLLLFILFIAIRLRWNQAWRARKRVSFHQARELSTTTMFTLVLLATYVSWLASNTLQFADIPTPTAIQYCGSVIAASGLLLLQSVHAHLGKNFSPHLEISEEQTLIQSGPYKFIRHPMYTSGFLYLSGAGTIASNWVVLVLPVIAFSVLVLLRVGDEEKMLAQKFGSNWEEYRRKTGRFFFRLNRS